MARIYYIIEDCLKHNLLKLVDGEYQYLTDDGEVIIMGNEGDEDRIEKELISRYTI